MQTIRLFVLIGVVFGLTGCVYYRALVDDVFGSAFKDSDSEIMSPGAIATIEHTPGVVSENHFQVGDKFRVRKGLQNAYVKLGADMRARPEWSGYDQDDEIRFVSKKFPQSAASVGTGYSQFVLCADNVQIHGSRHVLKIFTRKDNSVPGKTQRLRIEYDDYQPGSVDCDKDQNHSGSANAWL